MTTAPIPAFPVSSDNYANPDSTGMTLRDHFAGLAIGGLMAMIAAGKHDLSHLDGSTQEERLAVAGYRVADAMLKARETP